MAQEVIQSETGYAFDRGALLHPLIDEESVVVETQGNNYYLDRQAGVESNARSYPRRIPIAIRRADGIFVEDMDGRQYMDCLAGAGALALGHHHPVIVEAIRRTLAEGIPFQTLDLTTPVKDLFVEELFASLPKAFASQARIQFCGPTGADAIEAAIKLAKTATGRRSVLAFHGAYHGMTHGALALTGEIAPKLHISGLMSDVHFLPFPYVYRCPFMLGGEIGWRASLAYIERLLDDSNSGITPPAAMILEAVQGEGGVIPAPDEWLREIRRMTKERGIPLIIDEVQTGVGRTGCMYAFEHAGIQPDILVLSKAIGGGLPLSVVMYHKDLDHWQPGAHAGTFRGNQLAMATGTATLQYVKSHRLELHAHEMGIRLMGILQNIQKNKPQIGDIRGRGLMIGIEIVNPVAVPDALGIYPPNRQLAVRIQMECLKRGLIVELGGRQGSVVRLLPPLIVTSEQIDQIGTIFSEAIRAVQH
ncbi:diaminobutyrate--2-oxoglutarate transaminase [Methylovulum psychrotolerans]|uniref:Diaminobutyrate--2-oxoglutarate transaminase n=1 Tax=Methylovulum psychrotolerans TaxID=1704499 RepID=A0A1Z4BU76_9GAMM|nr:diaminobutyrate--2-oxoglutarate transaminase [Methylovulum psychrotolerans]ASF44782.1 diaminobutyrate--2-oxoglutarate transaminase [Methylovulum psychrotolerans]